jgi:hypothetical protein
MKRCVGFVVLLTFAPACAYRWIERRVDALSQVVDEATRAGAATCAPAELALSRVHLEFARSELSEGDAPRAERHLTLAEPNAQAALRLAKEQKCTVQVSQEGAAYEVPAQPRTARLPKSPAPSSPSMSIAAAQPGVRHDKR